MREQLGLCLAGTNSWRRWSLHAVYALHEVWSYFQGILLIREIPVEAYDISQKAVCTTARLWWSKVVLPFLDKYLRILSVSTNFPNKSSFFKQNLTGTADCATISDSFLAENRIVSPQTPTTFKELATVDSCHPILAEGNNGAFLVQLLIPWRVGPVLPVIPWNFLRFSNWKYWSTSMRLLTWKRLFRWRVSLILWAKPIE